MNALADVLHAPDFDLRGTHLIAASAGTGKTYSIQSLYLRLLLQGFSVRQVLVVTFTEAATQELRERLRAVLIEAARQLREGGAADGKDDRVSRLLALVPPEQRGTAAAAIRAALLDFDLAAIHTIHGFCLRTLARFAFETGQPFQTTPVAQSTADVDRLCADWWRLQLYGLPLARAALALEAGLSMPALRALARRLIAKPDAIPEREPLALDALPEAVAAVLAPRFAAGPPDVPPGSDDLPAAGAAVRQELADALRQCRDAAVAGAWETAAAALLRADGAVWRSPAWSLPFDGTALVAACTALREALHNQRTFAFADGRLTCPAAGDLTALDDALRAAVTALREPLATLRDRRRFPLKNTDAARGTYAALGMLEAYCRGAAAAPKAVVDAVRVLARSDPRNIAGRHAVSLECCAPAWHAAVGPLRESLAGLLPGAALAVRARYRAERLDRDTISFDDYLANLRAALEAPDGAALRTALRGEYRAALIDEFQDTDPVQYAIFRAVFRDAWDAPCFLVGDPKQAIYRFRNGDLETYLAAIRDIPPARRHVLDTNYRSEAPLVAAVNALFGDAGPLRPPAAVDAATAPATAGVFQRAELACDGRLGASGKRLEEALTIDGRPDPRPFKIWHFAAPDDARACSGPPRMSADAVWRHTAAGIRELLDDPRVRIGMHRVRPGDIAVLTMTHREALAVEAELHARRVPVVRQGAQVVFDTPEARDTALLLAAMCAPRDVPGLRATLASRLLGLTPAAIRDLNAGRPRHPPPHWQGGGAGEAPTADAPMGIEHWSAFFDELHARWTSRGFAAAFGLFAERSGLRARLAAQPRGERALTNTLQLAELLHRAATENHLAPAGLRAWLARQMDPERREVSDEFELRLETDDDAVRIMTVFKSKGLQFPIVFVPALWRRKARAVGEDGLVEYHREARLIVGDARSTAKPRAEAEAFQEDVRLAYVALTRAVHRTVLVWGDLPASPARHALAALLGPRTAAEALRQRLGDDAPIEIIACAPDTPADAAAWRGAATDAAPALTLPPAPWIDKGYGQASFTSLAPHAAVGAEPDPADRDALAETVAPAPDPTDAPETPLLAFPAGTLTGKCWHAIFEQVPFDAGTAAIRALSAEQLTLYGLIGTGAGEDHTRLNATAGMVADALRLPLPPLAPGEPGFALRDVAARERRTEWAFAFPAAARPLATALRTAAIAAVLRSAWDRDPACQAFLERLRDWDRPIPGGYLAGVVDLLFRHRDRFYIVDWKSNRRGGRTADFDPAGIRDEMATHAYFLQYLLYAVAVHQYLKAALSGYRHARHFGGVYYLFLRAVDGVTARGVFVDRPSEALLEALSDVVGDFRDRRSTA